MKILWAILCLLSLISCASDQTDNSRKDPVKSAEVRAKLAAGYYGLGQYGIAIEEAKKALQFDEENAQAYNVLGLVYFKLKENEEAQTHFLKALKLDPNDSDIQHNYGIFLCQTNRPVLAIPYFMQAIKNPLYTSAEKSYVSASVCLNKMNDKETAFQMLMSAYRIAPTSSLVLSQMIEVYVSKQDWVMARFQLNQFLKVSNPSSEILKHAILIEQKLGDTVAEQKYREALRK